jgi:hypothetical protein
LRPILHNQQRLRRRSALLFIARAGEWRLTSSQGSMYE